MSLSLVCRGAERRLQLADFGASKLTLDPTATLIGTPLFMSPEMLMGEAYHHDVDIYALGCTILTLGTNTLPFETGSLSDLKVNARDATRLSVTATSCSY